MKIRNGFVSNSSSSSFIVVVPDSFVPKTEDKNVLKLWAYMKANDGINSSYNDFTDIEEDEDDWFGEAFETIQTALRPYIVERINGGPDDGTSVYLINNETIRKNWEKK